MKIIWQGPLGETPGIGPTKPDDVLDVDDAWAEVLIAQGVARKAVTVAAFEEVE